MDFDQLRYFLQVAERGNFTRASEDLLISQPALSRSIQKLEEELGQPLLERQTRKVVLTDAGKLLVDRARKILSLLDDAKAEICDDGESGRVRVAAIPTIAPYFLPERLRAFQQQFPDAQVVVQEDTTDNLLKQVAHGEVDVAIAALPITAKYVDVEPLFEEELLLVTSPDHPLARKKTVTAADIEDLPFVLLGEAHCLADNVITFCRQKSFHPITVERTSQLAMVQELVTLGHGVSLVPAMARERDASRSRSYRSLAGQKPTRTIVMITNPYRYHTRLVKRFQEHLRRK
ncbi:MAG: LysR family transcriptional regulator [Planctomycetaceae bacterium]|nr:LysR family transcriptional regulator [Planctomycetaceae bacterium]